MLFVYKIEYRITMHSIDKYWPSNSHFLVLTNENKLHTLSVTCSFRQEVHK